jgi:predicted MFS family arabinose efflux permease
VLGGAESFIITGALGWALALAGPQNTGRVMAWIGTAMYVAFAVGAPLGSALYAWRGFPAIALATAIVPAATCTAVRRIPAAAPSMHASDAPSSLDVLRAIWLPGIGLAFSGVGFGTLTTFVALLVMERGWGAPWLAFSTFSLAFVMARVALGQLPDRVGGAKVALYSVLIEAMGQALIWRAGSLSIVIAGAGLTGLGYSLVYPGLGVEAVRRAPARARALAMGAYTAFLDLTLGVTSPLLGWLAAGAGTGSVFLAGAVSVACSAAVALALHRTGRKRNTALAPQPLAGLAQPDANRDAFANSTAVPLSSTSITQETSCNSSVRAPSPR